VVIFLDHVLSNTETRPKAAQSWNRPTQRDNFVIRIGHVEKEKGFDRDVGRKLDPWQDQARSDRHLDGAV
jgi:hypothetical protein